MPRTLTSTDKFAFWSKMFVELLYLLNSSVINLFELERHYISWCHSNYCINHLKMSLQSILTWVMLHDQTNLDLLMTSQGALNYTDLYRCKISFRFIQFLMLFIWDKFYKAVPYGCSNVWTSFFSSEFLARNLFYWSFCTWVLSAWEKFAEFLFHLIWRSSWVI